MQTKKSRRKAKSAFQALKAAVQAGMDSGVSDRTVPQIMEGVETRLRANGLHKAGALDALKRLGLTPRETRRLDTIIMASEKLSRRG